MTEHVNCTVTVFGMKANATFCLEPGADTVSLEIKVPVLLGSAPVVTLGAQDFERLLAHGDKALAEAKKGGADAAES